MSSGLKPDELLSQSIVNEDPNCAVLSSVSEDSSSENGNDIESANKRGVGTSRSLAEACSSAGSMDNGGSFYGGVPRDRGIDGTGMGSIYEANKEAFKNLAKTIEEMGRPFFDYVFGKDIDHAGRYLSDVVLFDNVQLRDLIIKELDNYGRSRRKGMFGYSVESDHIHVIHDCTYGGAHCRDVFRRKVQPYGSFRPARTENKPICKFRRTDWYDVFQYFFLAKRGPREIFIGGESWQKPTDGNI